MPEIEANIRVSSSSINSDKIESIFQWPLECKIDNNDSRVIFEKTNFDGNEVIETHLAELCERLESRSKEIINLPSDVVIDIWCVIYSDSEFTGLTLDSELMKRISSLGVNIIFSFYECD